MPAIDLPFWIAVIGAVVVKFLTSQFHSWLRAFSTAFTAIFAAYIFTDPVVDWVGLDPMTYNVPFAALLALTGEGVMRTIITFSTDYRKIIEAIKLWRGNDR